MVGYKLSNNDWVTPFFVIFRSVREILLVTVFLEHPVPCVVNKHDCVTRFCSFGYPAIRNIEHRID